MKKIFAHKQLIILAFTGFILLLINCKSYERSVDTAPSGETEALMTLLENQSYKIEIHTMRPFNTVATQRVVNNLLVPTTGNNASRINVRGQGHFIKSQNETVKGDLPFFGEQRQGGGHYGNADIGISFDGVPKDYKVFLDKKRDIAMATFTAKHNKSTETYDVTISLFANRHADISIYSSHRTSIRYSGQLKVLENTEQ